MRLLSLELQNWTVHRHTKINDFGKSLLIEGDNGSGKTSILEAIRFIFSKDARGFKTKIRAGTHSAKVRLKFEKDGSVYDVEKTLSVDGRSEARLLVDSVAVALNPTETHNCLSKLLPEVVLEKLLYVPQGQVAHILDVLRLKEGKREMDAILGLDKLERVYERVKGEEKGKKEVLGEAKKGLDKFPLRLELERKIVELEEGLKSLEEEENKLIRELGEIRNRFAEVEKEWEELREKREKIEQLERRLAELRVEEVRLEEKIVRHNEELKELEKKKKDAKNTEERLRELEKYTGILDVLEKKEALQEKVKELETKLHNVEEQRKKALKELEKVEVAETEHPSLSKQRLELEKRRSALNQQLLHLKERLEQLEGLREEARCPLCGQLVAKDHLRAEKEKLLVEVSTLEDKCRKAETEIMKLEEKLRDVEKASETSKRLRARLEVLGREETELGDQLEEEEQRLVELERKLVELNYKGEELSCVKELVKEHEQLSQRLRLVKEELKRLETLGAETQRLLASKNELEAKRNALRREQQKLGVVEEGKLREVEENYKQRAEELRNLEVKKQELVWKKKLIESDLRDMKKELDRLEEAKRRVEELEKEHNLLKIVLEVFDPTKGIVKWLRRKFIEQLSMDVTSYFKRINRNPALRSVEVDEDYNVFVVTQRGLRSCEDLSGGEKVQLALALRVALMRRVSPIQLLMLDEPFGNLDEQHREMLGEALSRIAEDGQLIVVTHIPVPTLQLEEKLELPSLESSHTLVG